MQWNVFVQNINRKNIEIYNIFLHHGFVEGCRKAYREYASDKAEFFMAVRQELAYYFWSKCEWEIILSAWPPCERFQELKVDVFRQVILNWEQFCDYLWAHREELCTAQKDGSRNGLG